MNEYLKLQEVLFDEGFKKLDDLGINKDTAAFTIIKPGDDFNAAVLSIVNDFERKMNLEFSDCVYIKKESVNITDIDLFLNLELQTISKKLDLDLKEDSFLAFYKLDNNNYLIYKYEPEYEFLEVRNSVIVLDQL